MKISKRRVDLPIGRTAMIAFQMDAIRLECCKAARALLRSKKIDEMELEECARLDDALAEAQRVLKTAVSKVVISRLKRRSRSEKR